MNNLKIRETLIDLIMDISGQSIESDNLNISLTNDLNFDSLMFIRLVVEIEKIFSIEFDDEFLLIEKIDQIETLLTYIESKVL